MEKLGDPLHSPIKSANSLSMPSVKKTPKAFTERKPSKINDDTLRKDVGCIMMITNGKELDALTVRNQLFVMP